VANQTSSQRGRKYETPCAGPAIEAARFHRLSARFALTPEECPDEFHSVIDFFFSTFHPAAGDACYAALNAAMAAWMLRRASRIQSSLAAEASPEAPAASRRLERYKAAHRRALSRALATLGDAVPAPAGQHPASQLAALLAG
jgi:hypothetical protein